MLVFIFSLIWLQEYICNQQRTTNTQQIVYDVYKQRDTVMIWHNNQIHITGKLFFCIGVCVFNFLFLENFFGLLYLHCCERFQASQSVVSNTRNVVVGQVNATQATEICKSFWWQFGNEVLLQAPVREHGKKKNFFSFDQSKMFNGRKAKT